MTLELCNEIIVLEAAAMLHDTDAEFPNIDFAHEAKNRHKYRGTGTKKYHGTVPQYFSTRYCPPLGIGSKKLKFETTSYRNSKNIYQSIQNKSKRFFIDNLKS